MSKTLLLIATIIFSAQLFGYQLRIENGANLKIGEFHQFKAYVYSVNGSRRDVTSQTEFTLYDRQGHEIDFESRANGEYLIPAPSNGVLNYYFTIRGVYHGRNYWVWADHVVPVITGPSKMQFVGFDELTSESTAQFSVKGFYRNEWRDDSEKGTWTAELGTISANGLYQAPVNNGTSAVEDTVVYQYGGWKFTHHVTVHPKRPDSETREMKVTVWDNVRSGATAKFTAFALYGDEWRDASDLGTWSAGLGTISDTGLYTAPANTSGEAIEDFIVYQLGERRLTHKFKVHPTAQ